MNIYPKASSPITADVLRMANERAARWMNRCLVARAETDRLKAIIADLEETA